MPYVGIGDNLEDGGAQGRGRIFGTADGRVGGSLPGRRQIGDDPVQQGLQTDVAQGGTAEHGYQGAGNSGGAQGGAQVHDIRLAAVQPLLEERVIGFADRFQQCVASGSDLVFHVGGNRLDRGSVRPIAPDQGPSFEEIDQTCEVTFATYGNLQGHGAPGQPGADPLEDVGKVGARAVEFVDEDQAGQSLPFGVHPHGSGLRLDPANAANRDHRSVDDAHGAHHFGRKIYVPRSVDQIDSVPAPVAGGGGRSDGDAALPLLEHPVELGVALIDAADPVNAAGVVEQPLRSGGFAGIYVGEDADDAHRIEREIRGFRRRF